ncbi:MAG: HAD family hydrolase [Candidatus Hydrogenedentes bacterium]|nr:HAD family hydrolase [Candidatus Hydrogenedentota bacterium]
MNKAAFLDRDGTLIEDRDYLRDPSDIVFLPGVLEALRRLRGAGYLLIVITNQSGVARGYFTLADLEAVHEELRRQFSQAGIHLDAIYACPHGPEDGCDCRKPLPGLTRRAAREWDIDLGRSVTVGDKLRDVEAGQSAGCGTNILLGEHPNWPGPRAADLMGAVTALLSQGGSPGECSATPQR